MSKPTKGFLRKQFKRAKELFGPGTDYYKRRMAKLRRKAARKDNPTYEMMDEDSFLDAQRFISDFIRRLEMVAVKHGVGVRFKRYRRDNEDKLQTILFHVSTGKDPYKTQKYYSTLMNAPHDTVPYRWLGMKEPEKFDLVISEDEHLAVLDDYLEELAGYYEAARAGAPEWKDLDEFEYTLPSLQKVRENLEQAIDRVTRVRKEEEDKGKEPTPAVVTLLEEEDTHLVLYDLMSVMKALLDSIEGEDITDDVLLMQGAYNDIARYYGLVPDETLPEGEVLYELDDVEQLARIRARGKLREAEAELRDDVILFELDEALREGQTEMRKAREARKVDAYFEKRYPREYPDGIMHLYAPVLSFNPKATIGDREVQGIFRFKLPYFPVRRTPRLSSDVLWRDSPIDRNRAQFYASPWSSAFGPREAEDSMLVSLVYMNQAFPALTRELLEAKKEQENKKRSKDDRYLFADTTPLFIILASGFVNDRGEKKRLSRIITGNKVANAITLGPPRYTASYSPEAKSELEEFEKVEGTDLTDLPFFTTLGAVRTIVTDLVKKRMSYEQFEGEGIVRYVNPSSPRGTRRSNPSLILPMAYALTSAVGLGASLYDLHQTIRANRGA